ncbi:YopT-type cysteine protease domain-containing protein [Variovorax sp. KK3]|uniref:YopT-type cysteine protease domain-containing protein n=1 Tax=Variovorax sp. KK3 TaxID=1855728 RepID=UPI00097C5C01|nr:YopT-type cysteine protease domain-containing protein [Variovorax sp. KK3]
MPDRAQVIQHLTNLSQRQIDNFNQSGEGRAWQAGVAMAQGYCHGICLDWVRRVLQGGRASYGPNPARQADEGYDFAQRRHDQANRQGNAWDQFYAIRTDVRRVNDSNYDTARAAYEAEFNKLRDLLAVLVPYYNSNRQLGNSRELPLSDSLSTRLRSYYTWTGSANSVQVGTLLQLINGLQAKQGALQAPQRTGAAAQGRQTWDRFTARMDDLYPKGRTFANVDLVHLDPTTGFNTLAAAIASVTDPALNTYGNNMAMVIGIDMTTTTGPSGHAVAMHWTANNNHVFMDPNYGMFEFASLDQGNCVRSALQYLFGTVYPAFPTVTAVLNRIEYGTYRRAA